MEQEPQRELTQYTYQRTLYWLRQAGHLSFILISIFIFVATLILLAQH